jgi:hypothetical protein
MTYFDDDDCRRAASMLAHYARHDMDGLALAITEAAVDIDRVAATFSALLAVVGNVVPTFRAAETAAALEHIALRFAERAAGGAQ